MIRILSNGIGSIEGKNIGLIDERGEIAAMYQGIPQNDIGVRTDVMNHCKKSVGMRMMIRSMGPEIIATDEIGEEEEIDAILDAKRMGIKLLLTAHGEDISDISEKFLKKNLFHYIVELKRAPIPGSIKKIWMLESDKYVLCS